MSGPKGARYAVVSEAELRRRAAAAARSRHGLAVSAWEGLCREVGEAAQRYASVSAVGTVPRRPDPHDARDLDAATEELHDLTARTRALLQTQIRSAVTGEALSRLSGGFSLHESCTQEKTVPAAAAPVAAPGDRPEVARDEAADRLAEVERILSAVRDGATEADLASLTVASAAVVAESTRAGATARFDELRVEVTTLNKMVERRLAAALAADELDARLAAGAEAGLNVTGLQKRIAVARAGEPTDWDELDAAVAAAEDAARQELDRRFAAQALVDAFSDLGMEMEESFSTLLVEGGTAHVRSADWQRHAVRIRLPSDGERLRFNVVRTDGDLAISSDDALVEQSWCHRFDELTDALGRHGVDAELVSGRRPGELPVQVVAADSVGFSQRPAVADAVHERHRGH